MKQKLYIFPILVLSGFVSAYSAESTELTKLSDTKLCLMYEIDNNSNDISKEYKKRKLDKYRCSTSYRICIDEFNEDDYSKSLVDCVTQVNYILLLGDKLKNTSNNLSYYCSQNPKNIFCFKNSLE